VDKVAKAMGGGGEPLPCDSDFLKEDKCGLGTRKLTKGESQAAKIWQLGGVEGKCGEGCGGSWGSCLSIICRLLHFHHLLGVVGRRKFGASSGKTRTC